MYDVIVIGSGVAGTTAGYFLAGAGKKVLLMEKEIIPRYKTCGGGVVPRATKLLPYEIDSVIDRKIYSADIFDQSNGLHFHIKRDIPVLNMTMREKLDHLMLEQAVGNGGESLQRITVTDIIANKDYVEVITDCGNFISKYVIGADGATGITAKKFGVRNSCKKVPAIESEIYVSDAVLNKFNISVRFDFGIIPHGYGWVFPKKEHLSVGILTMNNSGMNLNQIMKNYLQYLNLTKINKEEKHGYVIPLCNKSGRVASGRILLVGDAAGFADPVTAEGISYAIESGKYAAESILIGGEDVASVNKRYEASIKRIFTELKYARILAYFIYNSLSLRSFVFRRYGKEFSNLMTDIITGRAGYSELMKQPLNYLKLLRPQFLRKIST